MIESVPGWFHQLPPDLQSALIRAPHRVLDADQVQVLSQRSGVVGDAYFVSHGGGSEGFRLAPAVVAGIEAETRRRTAWWNALQPATREGLLAHVDGTVPAQFRDDALSPGPALLTDTSSSGGNVTGQPFMFDPFTRAFIAAQIE